MSTLKRIFGRAKKLGGSPQREPKNSSSPKNSDARTVLNTIASETPTANHEDFSPSITENESDTASISSRLDASSLPLDPPPPYEEPSTEVLVEPASDETDVAAVKDALSVPTVGASTSADEQTQQQHPWSSLADGNEPIQEISIVIAPRIVDSVVSEDGDGAKIPRIDAGEPQQQQQQQQLSQTCLRQHGDELSDDARRRLKRDRSSSRDGRNRHRTPSKRSLVDGDAGSHHYHRPGSHSEIYSDKKIDRREVLVVHSPSNDDLKRTMTLPTLQRAVPISVRRSNTLLPKSASSSCESNGGQVALIRTVRSVIDASLVVSNDIPGVRSESMSSVHDGTLSVSGRWSAESDRQNVQRVSSASFNAVEESQLVAKLASENEMLREENVRLRRVLALMEARITRHDDDICQLREEVDAVYVEVGNVSSEMERCRMERDRCWNVVDQKAGNEEALELPPNGDFLKLLGQHLSDLNLNHERVWSGRKKQHINNFFLQMLLSSATVKTGRSSLTLHSGEAAEAALAEQLQQLEEEGPLVPFEGNQLVAYSPRSYIRFHPKPDYEGSFIRRGFLRAILEVTAKARRFLTVYSQISPIE